MISSVGQLKAVEAMWSPTRAARELDALLSYLPTALLEGMLKLERSPGLWNRPKPGATRETAD